MTRRQSNPDEVHCYESATYQTGNVRLDRKAGILHGVKVCGLQSVKGRRYTLQAFEDAKSRYDNVLVNLDHALNQPDFTAPNTPIRNRFGRLKNPVVRSDGLYADLKYNPKHSWAGEFEWFAENDPAMLGLSHNAVLRGPVANDGNQDVSAIPKVYCVDIVADPATTRGLHESQANTDGESDDSKASLDMSDYHALNDGDDDEEPNECDAKAVELVSAILNDTSLSKAEKRTKVLVVIDKLLCSDEETDETPEPKSKAKKMPDEPAKESVVDDTKFTALQTQFAELVKANADLTKRLDEYQVRESIAGAKIKATELCKKAGLGDKLITPTFVDILVNAQESTWEEKIADRKLQIGSSTSTPTSAERTPTEDNLAAFEKHIKESAN